MKPFYLVWMTINADNAFEPVLDQGRWKTDEEVRTYARGLRLIFNNIPRYVIFRDTEGHDPDVLAPTT